MLRRRWPEVLDTLSRLRKATWALVSQNAQVADLTDTTLHLTFASAGLATAFRNSPGAELVQRAVRETLGFDVRVEGGLDDPARSPAAGSSARPSSAGPAGGSAPSHGGADSAAHQASGGAGTPVARIAGVDPAAAAASWDAPATPVRPARDPSPGQPAGASHGSPAVSSGPPSSSGPQAPGASSPSQPVGGSGDFGEEPPDDFDPGHEPPPEMERESPRQAAERRVALSRREEIARTQVIDDPQPDDEDLASSGLVGAPLVAQMLGGVVVNEILDSEG